MNYSPELINSVFFNALNSSEHVKEAQQMFAGYVKAKLRDVEFSRKILPPTVVSATDRGVQVSTRHDGLVYVGEIEPESGAAAVAWTGSPQTQYISSRRYEVPFFQISSREYSITEQELLASRTPITRIIDRNTVKDLGTIEDLRFLTLCEYAVQATGKIVKGTATTAGAASGDIEPADIINLKNQIASEERPATTLLINEVDLNKVLKWDALDIGYTNKGEAAWGSKVPNMLFGLKLVVTAKTYLLKEGNIWAFSDPEYLGTFLVLGNVRFDMKKEFELLSWKAWNLVAMAIANAYSVAKLEIYSGESQALPSEGDLFTDKIGTPPTTYPTIVRY